MRGNHQPAAAGVVVVAAADTTREGALEHPARLQVVATGQFRLEARSHSCGEGYWTCRPLALITLNSLSTRWRVAAFIGWVLSAVQRFPELIGRTFSTGRVG